MCIRDRYKPAIAHYVEPTDTSPAKNVPIPVIDTVAQRTVSLEGAYKTLAAYQSAYIAAMYNGDLQYLKGLVHGADLSLIHIWTSRVRSQPTCRTGRTSRFPGSS